MASLFDLLQVLIGFSLIIVLHELGHFLAARWAGIRVLAFALGFGPAIVSYRKGIGVRLGSSEREFQQRVKADRQALRRTDPSVLSPTEYRWNVFPLGGYVKMLGQDDADPSARSDEPDSYQSCKPWKRMVVISAGVVMNIITAAVLFLIVFGVGLKAEAPMVGSVQPDSPAAAAVAANAAALGVTRAGLQPGDTILAIDGDEMAKFQDITAASIMSARDHRLAVDVRRPGVSGVLHFSIQPRLDPTSNTLAMGIAPAATGTLLRPKSEDDRRIFADSVRQLGLPELKPGMSISKIGDRSPPADRPFAAYDIDQAYSATEGRPVAVEFNEGSQATRVMVPSVPELQHQRFETGPRTQTTLEHLLGLAAVMRVAQVPEGSNAAKAGLQKGDLFARLGDVEWPSRAEGLSEIRRDDRSSIPVVVARRESATGAWKLHDLGEVPVRDGKIGFGAMSAVSDSAVVARWPDRWKALGAQGDAPAERPSGAKLNLPGGAEILAVNGEAVTSLADVRDRVRALASVETPITLKVRLPLINSNVVESVTWKITPQELASAKLLGWQSSLTPDHFEPAQTVLKADGPLQAISMGLRETHKAMIQTYLTIARLFQGTVKVEHLKGPVGIAHVGTLLADRGTIWLLFFMAAISVNLAVINFLPLPIVDGGQFLFILYEQVTGKPVSVAVQNVAALTGLALIGCMFLIVTFNDIKNLFIH